MTLFAVKLHKVQWYFKAYHIMDPELVEGIVCHLRAFWSRVIIRLDRIISRKIEWISGSSPKMTLEKEAWE